MRLIRLMTNRTVGWWLLLLLTERVGTQCDVNKTWAVKRQVATDYFKMSLVRKVHRELTDGISSWLGSVSDVAETRKHESHSIPRRYGDVAIRADCGRRKFTRKKLLPMTIKTC